jgi:hypothetical protein
MRSFLEHGERSKRRHGVSRAGGWRQDGTRSDRECKSASRVPFVLTGAARKFDARRRRWFVWARLQSHSSRLSTKSTQAGGWRTPRRHAHRFGVSSRPIHDPRGRRGCVLNSSSAWWTRYFFIFDFFYANTCFSRTFCMFLFIFDSALFTSRVHYHFIKMLWLRNITRALRRADYADARSRWRRLTRTRPKTRPERRPVRAPSATFYRIYWCHACWLVWTIILSQISPSE